MIKNFRSFINEAVDDSDKYDFFDHGHDDDVDLETIAKFVEPWIGDNAKMIGKMKIMLVLGDTGRDVTDNGNVNPAFFNRIKYVDASRINSGDIDSKYDGDDLTIFCTYNLGGADSSTFKRLMDMLERRNSGNAHIFIVTESEYERLLKNTSTLALRFDGIWKI